MTKKKVALYLTNRGCEGVDLSSPEDGNPGIGGTQYNFLTLPYYYTKYFDDVEFTFYAHITDTLPKEFEAVRAESASDAATKAKENECDIFVYRPTQDAEGFKFLIDLKDIKIKTIAWVHNTPFKQLSRMARHPFLVRYINVSNEQYDMLRDHPIIYKSDVILNGFDPKHYSPKKEVIKEKTVVYMGSIVPGKGFHVLARVWKKVLEQVPDAKLEVIGTGQLYNRNSRLGKWGIADENYEAQFVPFLCDECGHLLKNITFHGVLGKEKIPIIQRALVGCPNPSGVTENCPGVAIEFQACGTAVVSGAFWGLLDTVDDGKTGLLGTSDRNLIDNIVFLLKNEKEARTLGQNGIEFITRKFDHQKICGFWHRVFLDSLRNENVSVLPLGQNLNFEYKMYSEKLRLLKVRYRVFNLIPSYMFLRPYHRKLKKLFGFKL
jgi:glycosyltransferase involved in cell wall biosynthesis